MTNSITPTPSCADPSDPESISVAEALRQISAHIKPLRDIEELPLRDCLGRICAEAIRSPIDVPGHANSAMDGYAIACHNLTQGQVTIFNEIGTAFAGKNFEGICSNTNCIRIMTGAVIPEGTDTVIMQEQAQRNEDGSVSIGPDHQRGENIRNAGEDVRQGDIVLDRDASIQPACLGVLASLGIARLKVYRKPVVAYFSTGDELVSIDKPLLKGQIYDSNRYTLFAMLAQLEVDSLDLGVIQDDPNSIKAALQKAAQKADLVITTGGVSVGQADYIKTVLEEIGQPEFWKIAIKPGRPLTFGNIGNCVFMGLPGNPVAVMVTFNLFAIPAIRKLSGATAATTPIIKARAQEKLRKKAGRFEVLRGIASMDSDHNWKVISSGKQGSGILTSISRANCFILLGEDNNGVEPGDIVNIQLFDRANLGVS